MRVAIVNDLALAREVLRRVVLSAPGSSVAWTAADGDEAVRKAAAGGPDALAAVLAVLPADFPAGILVAQHIAAEYARGLADRLAARCKLPVRVAQEGDIPAPGVVYLAATDDHLELGPRLRLRYTPVP